MGKTVLQGGRFTDAQRFRFQAMKLLDMGSDVMKRGDLLILRIAFSGCEPYKYGQ
jgi:hypothetical protein